MERTPRPSKRTLPVWHDLGGRSDPLGDGTPPHAPRGHGVGARPEERFCVSPNLAAPSRLVLYTAGACDYRSAANRSVARISSWVTLGLSGECPAWSTITSSARGHAC